MKSMFSHFSKKWLSILLAVLMVTAMIPLSAISAYAFSVAPGQTVDSEYGGAYVGYDGLKYPVGENHYALRYKADGTTYIEPSRIGTRRTKLNIVKDGVKRQALCIEYGVDIIRGKDTYASTNGENSAYFNMLPMTARRGILLACVYGWHPGKALPIDGINEDDYSLATQEIIWEYQQGIRISPTARMNNGNIRADQFYDEIKDRPAELAYNWILSKMAIHAAIPSFATSNRDNARTHTLKYDHNTGKYSATLTDTNNIGIDISTISGSGVSVTRNGNNYTFMADAPLGRAIVVEYKKNIDLYGEEFLVWGNVGYQTMITGVSDPIRFYLAFDTEANGAARIIKISEDGKVDDLVFRIQGDGVDQTVKTANGGVFQLDNLKPGAYTVTETEYAQYEPQEVRRITVVSGQVTTVTFSNTLRRGDLTVKKTAEDGLVEGLKFRLSGTSLSGIEVNEFAVTDENGVAEFKDVLIGTGYVLEEIDTPLRYVVPDKQTAAIEWNKVTEKSFDNDLKKFNVTVTKSDRRTGLPQGDASLAGAKYGIYKGNQLIDTYTTDANGQFVTKYYICGDDWSLKEISPSEGYLLNTESQHIGAEAKLYTVEYNLAKPLDSLEDVIKGKIAVIKHCDDGTTKIETPEKGAEFEVYLKAAGSYENAEETERDILVCDENGFAETKDLPYGEYTVKQTKGWEGKELLAPFNVFVKENGETYRFLINNATFEALIEIVKKDAETGKVILAAGIGFKVRNTDTGEYIVQHINYPTPTDIDIYYTDVTGKLMMPEKLPYGNYEIIEQCTAYGYVLDSAPIAFRVDGEKTVVTVEKFNMPQKGIIRITKSGEIFFSAVETDGVYSLVFADKSLAGATYEITAAEDIITPDGTLRYAEGTVVDTVTTDENGNAASKPLYLGKYMVRETKAPYGMVLNGTPKTVELTYAGETVEITETAAEFYNERQKAALSLAKILGRDETFDIGDNGEILSVQFGLYAAEDLFAADGSFVPKNGLLEIANCDENGNITFVTDIPVGAKLYVKEIATDSHYILSDEKYPVTFDYAGQDTALVEIKANGGEAIKNDILYGSVKGLKIDRETEKPIVGAKFGLFRSDETEFTAENTLLTAESGEDGIFVFENVPYGNWLIKELQPADGYLENNEIYPVRISENGQTVGITVVNDRIPEIGTKATVNGEKTAAAEGDITIEDTVSYKHLIPGKAYTVKGILMDKATGKAFLVDGKELTSEVTFTPEESCGEVTVRFTFDGSKITKQTDIVVFETLYYDGAELAAHADIEDGGQTVTLIPPKPDNPQTGDNSNLGFWIGLGSVALGGVIACIIMYCKRKKDEDDE